MALGAEEVRGHSAEEEIIGDDDISTRGGDYHSVLGLLLLPDSSGGGCYPIDELTLAVSGAAGTAAIAAAKMGLKTLAVGGVGDDLMGRWVIQRLQEFGVDTSTMQCEKGWKTSCSIVTTRADRSTPALHPQSAGATGNFFVGQADAAESRRRQGVPRRWRRLDARHGQGTDRRCHCHGQGRRCSTTVDSFRGLAQRYAGCCSISYTDYSCRRSRKPGRSRAWSTWAMRQGISLTFGVEACVFTLGGDGAYCTIISVHLHNARV